MSRSKYRSATYNRLFVVAAAVLASGACFGQAEIQLRARQLPGWDSRAREGRCDIRVWVDNRAEVRMRGDGIFVKTVEGARGHDEGSECSQPLPTTTSVTFEFARRRAAARSAWRRSPAA